MKRIILLAAASAALALGSFATAAEVERDRRAAAPAIHDVQEVQAQLPLAVEQIGPSIGFHAVDYQAVKAKLEAGEWLGALVALLAGAGGLGLAMTTLAVNSPRAYEIGNRNEFPVIASDIIYEGAAVGLVDATGHARPLNAADRFAGFAEQKADNSAGAAAAINVRVIESGKIQLPVTGAVITDVGQAVYAQDDDAFSFSPVAGVFIGRVHRFVSAGVVIVSFDAPNMVDPWAHYTVRETLAGTKTFDAEDCGKLFCVTDAGDGDALTLPAIADGVGGFTIMAVGAFGTTAVVVDANGSDKIHGPNLAGTDGQTITLTKATQRRGDFVTLDLGDADGHIVTGLRGIWAVVA